jgi:hypothetical protein
MPPVNSKPNSMTEDCTQCLVGCSSTGWPPCWLQVELEQLGLMTTYEKVAIKEAVDPAVWEGVNKYWHLPFYMIPTCTFGQSGSS